MLKAALLTLFIIIMPFSTHAKTLWSDFSVSYLKGGDYEVGDPNQEVITFEYVNGSTWGDTFLFFDRLMAENGDVETYGEFSPRFQLKELDGVMKKVYLATTVEMGPGTNYLVGLGTDLDIPYFSFFQLNIYHRNNAFGENNAQATIAWSIPLGPLDYSGFMDYATSTDASDTSINITSQLGYNIAPHFNLENKFLLGIEYVYWNSKYGIEGVDERNINLLAKYHF